MKKRKAPHTTDAYDASTGEPRVRGIPWPLGAAFLTAEFSFDGDVRHAGYIATWITLLRNDKRAFFTGASKAQAAADYLRGLVLAESIAKAVLSAARHASAAPLLGSNSAKAPATERLSARNQIGASAAMTCLSLAFHRTERFCAVY